MDSFLNIFNSPLVESDAGQGIPNDVIAETPPQGVLSMLLLLEPLCRTLSQENAGDVSSDGGGGSAGRVATTHTDVDKVPQGNARRVSPVRSLRGADCSRRMSPASSVGAYLDTAGKSEDFEIPTRDEENGDREGDGG